MRLVKGPIEGGAELIHERRVLGQGRGDVERQADRLHEPAEQPMGAFASVELRELARHRLEQAGNRRQDAGAGVRGNARGPGNVLHEVRLEDYEQRIELGVAAELLHLSRGDVERRARTQPVACEIDGMRALAAGHKEEVMKGRPLRSRQVVVPLAAQKRLQGEHLHPQGAVLRERDVSDAEPVSHFDHPSFHIDLVRRSAKT